MKQQYEVVFSLTKRVFAENEKEAVLLAEEDISEEVCCENVFKVIGDA